MLVGSVLKNLMVDAVYQKALSYNGNYPDGLVVALELQEVLLDVVSDYLLNNMKFSGIYTGMIPGIPPVADPLSGSYILEPLAIPGLSPSLMLDSVSGGIQSWYSLLMSMIKTLVLNPNVLSITIVPTPPLVGCVPGMLGLSVPDDFDTVYLDLANVIVDSLNSTPVSGISFPATSVAGGQGVMTLTAVV